MPYKWRALVAVALGTYMATMDFSIVNVALPELADAFSRSPDTVVWVALISSLVVTGLTLTAGRTGDLFGRKKVYILGWLIFTIGVSTATFAQNVEQLVAIRFVQCIGIAMAIANGNAIITDAFPARERGRALGTNGSVVGAGLMSGPIFGGFILTFFDWHAIFWLRAPVGLAVMALAVFMIRESEAPEDGQRRLDIPGALLLFASLASLLLAANRGRLWGWDSPAIIGLFIFGAIALALLIRTELRSPSPIISLALFKVRSFAASLLALVLNFIGQSAVIFLMPFYLLEVREFSTARTGILIATVPLMMLLFAPLSGYLSDRLGFRYQTTIGCAFVTLGLISLSTLQADTPQHLIAARLALVGLGSAIFGPPNTSTIMGSVPRAMLGTASASVATSRNIGNAVGLAMASAVLVGVAVAAAGLSADVENLPPGAVLDGVRAAFLVAACASSLGIVATLFRGPTLREIEENEAAEQPASSGSARAPEPQSSSR